MAMAFLLHSRSALSFTVRLGASGSSCILQRAKTTAVKAALREPTPRGARAAAALRARAVPLARRAGQGLAAVNGDAGSDELAGGDIGDVPVKGVSEQFTVKGHFVLDC
jgi:hypothetical protein